jgi:predicted O-linked N-acetylglucosamine transferase (SPINDLY family)
MTDVQVVQHMQAQQIDLLVDLSGHTANNRLGVVARRAAPVQAHYLGYFASTGLTEMDYWISDAVVTPPASAAHFSEQLWPLPRVSTTYQGREDAPMPTLRSETEATFRIGTFNQLGKLTPETLELWAHILKVLPQAQLLLKTKALSELANRGTLLAKLAQYDVGADRVQMIGATESWAEHMAAYDQLDVALDPIGGMGGGTTTCDALWMGVPVVSLTGEAVPQRMTTSTLHAVGCADWATSSPEGYIRKVIELAQAKSLRHSLRAGLREQMRASPLCDPEGLTRALEQAYIQMFKRRETYQST